MNSIIRPAVSTGMANSSRTLVTSVFQTNIGMRMSVRPGARILKIVARKLIAVRTELKPSSVNEAIHRSSPAPPCSESGAYPVQPAFAAPPTAYPENSRMPPSGTIQKDRALMRGNAMSAAPTWSGTMTFWRPDIMGITKRKIIVVPWMVNSWLYVSASNSWTPGTASSVRISRAKMPPTRKKLNAVVMYIAPIFL